MRQLPVPSPAQPPPASVQPNLNDLERRAHAEPHNARALARYGTALVDAGQARVGITQLRHAVAIDPGLTAAWHNLGLAAERQGWLDLAAQCYGHVVTAQPDHPGVWIKQGYVCQELGRYSEAERAFRRAAALQPGSSAPLVAIASLQYTDFHYDAALTTLKRAIGINPNSAAAYANMAAIQIEIGKLADAENAVRQAIRIEPTTPLYHLMLGRILASSPVVTQRADAQQELERALAANGQNVSGALSTQEQAEAYYYTGLLARLEGRPNMAVAAWRRSLSLDPARLDAMLALGHALVSQGGAQASDGWKLLQDYKQVQALRSRDLALRQQVEEHPDSGALRLHYGKLLMEQGNLSRAAWELHEGARLRPNDAVARQALNTVLTRQGRLDEVAEGLTKAR